MLTGPARLRAVQMARPLLTEQTGERVGGLPPA
jgi:hypothetical protein